MKNDAAFPIQPFREPSEDFNWGSIGLTKREYFAAMAMQGMCANPVLSGDFPVYALDAVKYADALIAELNKA